MVIRDLKENETLYGIIPDIQQCFIENPDEKFVFFKGFGHTFEVSRFDFEVIQMFSDTPWGNDYLVHFVLERQFFSEQNKPVFMASTIESFCKKIGNDAIKQYMQHFIAPPNRDYWENTYF